MVQCLGCEMFGVKFGADPSKPTHCKDCSKPLGYTCLKSAKPRCYHLDCTASATKGFGNGTPILYCAKDFKIVKEKTGQAVLPPRIATVDERNCPDCLPKKTRPSYGPKDSDEPTHCKPHGEKLNMVKILIDKHCKCGKHATYGKVWRRPLYCEDCLNKLKDKEDYRNVVSITCIGIIDGKLCGTRTTYGYPDGKIVYCAKCAKDIDGVVEKAHNKCKKCGKRPTFGIEKGKPTHCETHHDKKIMFDVVHKLCEVDGCKTRPTFGNELGKPLRCEDCKIGTNMVNVIDPRCEECGDNVMSRIFRPHCFDCYQKNNPEAKINQNYGTREAMIMSAIREKLNLPIIQNKAIKGGDSRRRPDGLIELSHNNIIIEIDEDQHKHPRYLDDDERILQIQDDLGEIPLVAIRFNIDYFVRNSVESSSLFHTIDGVYEIKDIAFFNQAIDELVETIQSAIDLQSEEPLKVIKLRYDEE